MIWRFCEPKPGDMIRVKAGAVYHYGIYVTDDEIIQFGLNPSSGQVAAKDLSVCTSSIDGFLLGGFLEVAYPDKKEAKKRLNPTKTVELARSRIGQKGYDILNNNCEHFAYECFAGTKRSEQAEAAKDAMPIRTRADVYVAEIPVSSPLPYINSRERRAEIKSCTNERVKREKAFAWALLEYAAKDCLSLNVKRLKFKKQENGMWTCPSFCFSISHSHGAVAVAISKMPIGVDIEKMLSIKPTLAKQILSSEETERYETLNDEEKPLYLTKTWVLKESIFKKEGGRVFVPNKINSISSATVFRSLSIGESDFALSVASSSPEETVIHDPVNL
ncbi:MAG: lecithin retinol acyltransferase family protein [Clostridia bacterium]|nr:lecithin retinol acyltransferase family protein [Clostridia bacterium]